MTANLIITNNPYVTDLYLTSAALNTHYKLCLVDGDTLEVLTRVRNICHSGAKLLTHPLSGSIKPNQTPYKTVVLAITEVLDVESIALAEDSWCKANSLNAFAPSSSVLERIRHDLCLIDLNLFKSYLLALGNG